MWLALDGSSGYSVHSATTAIDGLGPDQGEERVRRLIASGDADIWIGDYSDPSLTVVVNPDRALVMLLLEDGAWSLTAGDPAAQGDDTPERFTLENGQVDEFERHSTVTHAQAMNCVRSFLRDGILDPDVRWLE